MEKLNPNKSMRRSASSSSFRSNYYKEKRKFINTKRENPKFENSCSYFMNTPSCSNRTRPTTIDRSIPSPFTNVTPCSCRNLDEENLKLSLNSELNCASESIIKANNAIRKLKKENDSLNNQRKSLDRQLEELKNYNTINQENHRELENKYNINLDKLDRANDYIVQIDAQNYDYQNEINRLRNELKERDKLINDLKEENKLLHYKLDSDRKSLEDQIDQERRWHQNKVDELNQEIEALTQRALKLDSEIEELKRMLADMEKEKDKAKRFRNDTIKTLKELFTFYSNVYFIFNRKEPMPKLQDALNDYENYHLRAKLSELEEKIRKAIDLLRINVGKCIACDVNLSTRSSSVVKNPRKRINYI